MSRQALLALPWRSEANAHRCYRLTSLTATSGKGTLRAHVDVPPLDSIVEDFRAGERSKLILANRAIARFEKIGDPLESDLMRCSAIEL